MKVVFEPEFTFIGRMLKCNNLVLTNKTEQLKIYSFEISNSLIIHEQNTKEISTET